MALPKRKHLFLDVLKREYPFLISDETDVNKVRCTLCKSIFSVSHGGGNDIEKHIRANKHKESLAAKASSKKIYSFFVGKTIGDKQLDLAAKEGTFTFHTVAHSQSFQSMDCTSTVIWKLFEPMFTCAQTKV
jgi:hypothetical protein